MRSSQILREQDLDRLITEIDVIGPNWRRYRISHYFRLGEFVISESYPELAAAITPTILEAQRLQLLCMSILQPCRELLGVPIDIESGLRDFALNTAVGGVTQSDHLRGQAADWHPRNLGKLQEVFEWMKAEQLPYRQCYLWWVRKFIHSSINIPERAIRYKHVAWKKNTP